ncbi:MAG: hypothetical protein KatS3mg060_0957 [Dehalococcoidia bacterium]|nr:MAG: hypothetical protein KatS3mg060_0957 [Dehalococcoidia bacterium]
MDYTGLVARAIAIIRRTRALWIFAIVVALVEPPLSFGSGGTPGVNFNFEPRVPVDEAALVRSFVAALVPFLLILGLWAVASFFVAPLARGGLVWTAWRGAADEDPAVSEGFSASRRHYGPLLLIQLLNLIVPVGVGLLVAFIAAPFVAFVIATAGSRDPNAGALIVGLVSLVLYLIVAIVALVVLVIAVSALLQSLITLASIDVIIAENGAGEALRTAWRLITGHLGAVVVITILFAILSGIISALAAIPTAALFLIPIGLSSGGVPPFGLIFAGILILIPLTSLLQTPVQALRYTYFTLLYQGWTGR